MSDPMRCVKVRAAGPFSRSPDYNRPIGDGFGSRREIFAKAALSELQLPSRPRARGLTICSTPRRNRPRRSFLRLTPIARHAPGRTRSFSSIRCLPRVRLSVALCVRRPACRPIQQGCCRFGASTFGLFHAPAVLKRGVTCRASGSCDGGLIRLCLV
jgi:hypothetical protein